jgi:hypothetical protein
LILFSKNPPFADYFLEEYLEDSIFGVARTVSPFSNSKETFRLAKTWLRECVLHHDACVVKRDLRRPARLIHVGKNYGDLIKLVESPAEAASYVALSYSWGSGNPLKTERLTLDAFKISISHSDLPQSFQDAISICHQLEHEYLWIDALCIVQDDPVDWQLESSKMADVYEGAVVTIAAAWASDCTNGCFHRRYHWCGRHNQQLPQTAVDEDLISFNHHLSTGQRQTVYIGRRYDHETTDPVLLESSQSSPLYKRAWTFQERLLSRRLLHYTRSELTWECRTGLQCECGGNRFWMSRGHGLRQDQSWGLVEALNKTFEAVNGEHKEPGAECRMGEFVEPGFIEPRREAWLKEWKLLVAAYARRSITYSTDRLPAFSGIAKRFACPELGGYFAGIWEAELPMALLWQQDEPRNYGRGSNALENLKRKSPFIAPSWSWASVFGGLLWPHMHDQEKIYIEADVLDVQCQLAGLDSTGGVSGGHIVLNAPVLRFQWKFVQEDHWDKASYPPPPSLYCYADGHETGLHLKAFLLDPQLVNPASTSLDKDAELSFWGTASLRGNPPEPGERSIPKECVVMIIQTEHALTSNICGSLHDRLHTGTFSALLLAESKDVEGAYERVGILVRNGGVAYADVFKMETVKII